MTKQFSSVARLLGRPFGLTGDRKHGWWPEVLVAVSVVLLLFSFAHSVRDARQYHGCDLRGHITAARALLDGLNPYFYQWRPGMSETLLDPCRGPAVMSRGTVSPPILCLYALTARLPYLTVRWLWFGVSWVALILSVLLLARLPLHQDDLSRAMVVVCGFVFVGSSQIWRMHVERGQFYVEFVLLLALAFTWAARHESAPYSGAARRGRGEWLAGLAMGVAAALRPPLLLVAAPAVVAGRWRFALGTALGAALVLGVTLPITGLSAWGSFQRNAADADQCYLLHYKNIDPNGVPLPPQLSTGPPGATVSNGTPYAEGIDCGSSWTPYLYEDYSWLSLSNQVIYLAGKLGLDLRPPVGHDPRLRILRGAFLVVCLAVLGGLLVRRRARSLPLLLLIGAFLAVLGEYMAVPTRGLYAEVYQVLVYGLLGPYLLQPGLSKATKVVGWVGIGWAYPLHLIASVPWGLKQPWYPLSDLGPYSALVFFLLALLWVAREAASGRGWFAAEPHPLPPLPAGRGGSEGNAA